MGTGYVAKFGMLWVHNLMPNMKKITQCLQRLWQIQILKKIVNWHQNVECSFLKKGMGTILYVTKLSITFWVLNLRSAAKYKEDTLMPSKVKTNSNFENWPVFLKK